MKFTNYAFEILFVDVADPGFLLKLPVTVRASSYEHAVHQALYQGQQVVRDYNSERFLFMRLQKCPTP
jgi:hypothetical protein